jgi:hypothetical protein
MMMKKMAMMALVMVMRMDDDGPRVRRVLKPPQPWWTGRVEDDG